jgi:hypothetical protein
MTRWPVLALLLVAVMEDVSLAQPAGPEFRVNTYTSFAQIQGSVAFGGNGTFVIAWQSGSALPGGSQDGSLYGVYAQRYAANGTPVGPEFRVNTTTTDNQSAPSVAADGGGNFVVVWNSKQDPDASFGIYAQRFAADGSPRGGEFRVNTYTTDRQVGAAIASDPDGNFVVVWSSYGQDGNGYGIFGQRFAADGSPRGGEFQANTETSGNEYFGSVACDSTGSFVVVWSIGSFWPMGAGQRFDASGAPLGSEFPIDGAYPKVTWYDTDRYVVVRQAGMPFRDIFAQTFTGEGVPVSGEFRVNSYTNYDQKYPSVAADGNGGFFVVWQGIESVASDLDIFGRRFDGAGVTSGSDLRINTYTTSQQIYPRIASSPKGVVVIVWNSGTEDDTLYGLYGQRYSFVAGDVSGDGTVDVGDVFYLINALFAGGPPPVGNADANGDGHVDIADVFYLINYLFAGGPAPH